MERLDKRTREKNKRYALEQLAISVRQAQAKQLASGRMHSVWHFFWPRGKPSVLWGYDGNANRQRKPKRVSLG